ncbi:MAG TPA: hypothetical protein DEQ47_02620 [Solibacterales bacterium]|nr:hypothetical protein [Bryobacterales bacterium]
MADLNQSELAPTVARLLRRQRVLEALLGALTIVMLVLGAAGWHALYRAAHPQKLTLRRLDIVDEKGTVRVILAAPAPPPTHFNKVGRRDAPVSGVLLIDATGTERGGYVTSDGENGNALLTLDAQGKQTVLLLAEPQGSTLFRIWDRQNGSIVLGSGGTGPFLNIRKGDTLFFSAPNGNIQSSSSKPLFR